MPLYGFDRFEWWSQMNLEEGDASNSDPSYFWDNIDATKAQFWRFLAISDERYTTGDMMSVYSLFEDSTDDFAELLEIELASGVALASAAAFALATAAII